VSSNIKLSVGSKALTSNAEPKGGSHVYEGAAAGVAAGVMDDDGRGYGRGADGPVIGRRPTGDDGVRLEGLLGGGFAHEGDVGKAGKAASVDVEQGPASGRATARRDTRDGRRERWVEVRGGRSARQEKAPLPA
jgi:hypothetical protein